MERTSPKVGAGRTARFTLTVAFRNLPPGAVFDAASNTLSWTPGYDQAGEYRDIAIVVGDGKATVAQTFSVTVEQGWAKPVLLPVAAQNLREGERYALQLAGSMPGGLLHADGTTGPLGNRGQTTIF